MYRLLIVEDEFFSRQALQCSLESYYPDYFEILSTDNGLEALNLCQHKQPDIVLVDLNIPGISGLNLIQTLIDYGFPGKIIITTAHNRSKYIREALDLGVISYLLKPINPSELKAAMNKCLSLLQEKQESDRTSFDSLFSYAQSYLIHDILNCNAPENILSSVYGWCENGHLNAGVLIWCPEKRVLDAEKAAFSNSVTTLFEPYFLLLSAALQGNVLVFLHAKKSTIPLQISVILSVCMEVLRRSFPQGSLLLSEFSNTYSNLYSAMKKTLFLAEHEQNTFLNGNPLPISLWSPDDRLRLRQKFVQRLKERQKTQLVQYLKRKLEASEEAWNWIALFIEALQSYDPHADLYHLLTIFQSQNWPVLLESWLSGYYDMQSGTSDAGPVSKSQQAISIIRKNFSQDLTQENMAIRLGLTPTYFSNLFKKETGKSFPHYLSEIRIEHARSLIDAGEINIEKIALACGFYSKKYFLELFKKYSGCSFTQYLQNLHQKSAEDRL